MKTFKKVQKIVDELDQHVCDLCGDNLKIRPIRNWHVEVKRTEFAYEGGEMEREEFDVCADCWEDKVVPLFAEAFGVKPRVTR